MTHWCIGAFRLPAENGSNRGTCGVGRTNFVSVGPYVAFGFLCTGCCSVVGLRKQLVRASERDACCRSAPYLRTSPPAPQLTHHHPRRLLCALARTFARTLARTPVRAVQVTLHEAARTE